MAKLTKGWPHNSELYMTFREVRREIPRFNFPVPFRVVKPIKPKGRLYRVVIGKELQEAK